MVLYIAARFAGVIFDASAQRVERVANRDMGVLVCMVDAGLMPGDDLAPRQRHVDHYLEQVTLPMPMVLAVDDDPARRDAAKKLLQLFGTLADPRFQCGRRIHVTKGNLKR
jgi:hypothetical protein